MKYRELLLIEMVFSRKRIIRALESYDARIFEHAVKIMLMPQSPDVRHWKRELFAWAGYLASLRTVRKGNPPIGYDLAYEYLYRGPFVGNELGMTYDDLDLSIDVEVEDVHRQLQTFLTQLARDIGNGVNVEATINALG